MQTTYRSNSMYSEVRRPVSPYGRFSPVGVVVGLGVYSAVLFVLGLILAIGGFAGFGIALLVESALRAATAVGVSQRRKAWHTVGLVHSGLAAASALLALPFGLVGIIANILIIKRLTALRDRL